MGWKDDDDKAYTTSEGMHGRAFRRGVRKGLKAVTLGAFSDNPLKGSLTELAKDAARELPTAVRRARQRRNED